MKHYSTSTSRNGLRLPYSGTIVGHLAESLRLKTMLREDFEVVSYKTVQRYFSGDRIEAETVEQILDALVDSLVPGDLSLGKGVIEGFSLALVARSALQDYAAHWDRMAASANVHMFEVTETRDLPMPMLRLVALDLGIRIGGWSAIRFLMDAPINWEATWLDGGEFRRFIDLRRDKLGFTVGQLAETVGVSEQAVEGWRSASSLPTSNHIEALAKALAGDDLPRVEAEYGLRVRVAIEQVLADLKNVIGERRLQDIVDAIKSTAREVENLHRKMLSVGPPPESPPPVRLKWGEMLRWVKGQMLRGVVWELPVHGARCPHGEATAMALAELAEWRPEASADFTVLARDWSPRITYWMSHVGSAAQAIEFAKIHVPSETGCSPEQAEKLARAVFEGTLALGNMFWEPSPEMEFIRVSPPPFGKAMNRVRQADVAASIGDHATAIEHLRHAVRHQPQDASMHFSLGCALWQSALKAGDLQTVEEALLECRVAVQLDPEFGNARNEIGVILSNLRRHDEAEHAFAEAEPYHGQNNHHWFGRGNNYLALGRLEDARAAFVKAIELTGDGQHVVAKARLAATLMALGRKREAHSLGRQVHHVTGYDPTEDWERGIAPWAGAASPASPKRSTGQHGVGRNDPCPCGSGQKFKRCCGR